MHPSCDDQKDPDMFCFEIVNPEQVKDVEAEQAEAESSRCEAQDCVQVSFGSVLIPAQPILILEL